MADPLPSKPLKTAADRKPPTGRVQEWNIIPRAILSESSLIHLDNLRFDHIADIREKADFVGNIGAFTKALDAKDRKEALEILGSHVKFLDIEIRKRTGVAASTEGQIVIEVIVRAVEKVVEQIPIFGTPAAIITRMAGDLALRVTSPIRRDLKVIGESLIEASTTDESSKKNSLRN